MKQRFMTLTSAIMLDANMVWLWAGHHRRCDWPMAWPSEIMRACWWWALTHAVTWMFIYMIHQNIFSELQLTFTFAICCCPSICRLSVCRLSVVRHVSVTFVHPTQPVEILGNVSMPFGTLAIHWHPHKIKFYGDRPRGTPLPGELNTRGLVKYSDFWPIEGYISETVQDRR